MTYAEDLPHELVRRLGCTVEGCPEGRLSKGLCLRHYAQQRRGTKPTLALRRAPDGEGGRLSINLSRAHLKRLAAAAKKAGITRAAWLRRAIEENT